MKGVICNEGDQNKAAKKHKGGLYQVCGEAKKKTANPIALGRRGFENMKKKKKQRKVHLVKGCGMPKDKIVKTRKNKNKTGQSEKQKKVTKRNIGKTGKPKIRGCALGAEKKPTPYQ